MSTALSVSPRASRHRGPRRTIETSLQPGLRRINHRQADNPEALHRDVARLHEHAVRGTAERVQRIAYYGRGGGLTSQRPPSAKHRRRDAGQRRARNHLSSLHDTWLKMSTVQKGARRDVQTTPRRTNTRDDLPFQFLGVPTLLRATADTTNGAFGLIEHPMLPPGFASPTMSITMKTNLFMCSRDAWHSLRRQVAHPRPATSFREADVQQLQGDRPTPLRCCCWCRPAALNDSQQSQRTSW